MKSLKWGLATAVLAMLGIATAGEARAALVYNLDIVLNTGPDPDATPPWLKAEFTDVGNNVELKITNMLETTSEFATKFGFNVVGYVPSTLSIVQQGTIGASNPATTITKTTQDQQDLPGVKGFDVLLTWTTSNAGGGVGRFNFGDVLTFVISRPSTNLGESDFNALNNPSNASPLAHVAAHIQGIGSGASGSSVIGDAPPPPPPPPDPIPTPTPEPSTLLMGAVAMVGLGVVRFRSKKS